MFYRHAYIISAVVDNLERTVLSKIFGTIEIEIFVLMPSVA